MHQRIDLNSLSSFMVVARERSFTRAAAQLGVTQSALSHSMRTLEERMGVRLLARTTRGASPTEAGERLLSRLSPHYAGIAAELTAIGELRDRPSGTIRITTADHAATTILWPKLSKLLPLYPDIQIEINIGYGLVDIVAERFDAGVRIGDQIARDMIAVRISPDFRMTVAASPAYFERYPRPVTPQDLTGHNCGNLRLTTQGGLYAWEFQREGKALAVQVPGQVIFNSSARLVTAALEGHVLTYAPEDAIQPHVEAGRLVRVLDEWCPTFPGYHLYYPSRRQALPAFALVVEALRLRD
ncbi:LysR family transcriptional regulator [Xylophilus sp. GOD-11R]|uniref:LysR family transcriptional regulator n=1 Tax=Xylophilus sp. GOD-11R TaxID=3089814 RepID=UPI00298D2B57|nr:LysR family transcriptional regulator [Xylophilus sp. GOD-11R]WPB55812.1 LysR family transcriptional regulator [Xylophilus sp. GOD-11R]